VHSYTALDDGNQCIRIREKTIATGNDRKGREVLMWFLRYVSG